MGKQNENILSVVDIGTAKTVALVAEITDAGLRYRGHGIAASRGSRKGIIVDLDKATASVKMAMDEAELTAEVPLERAVVGVAGPHIRAANSQGGIALGADAREVLLVEPGAAPRMGYTAAGYSADGGSDVVN